MHYFFLRNIFILGDYLCQDHTVSPVCYFASGSAILFILLAAFSSEVEAKGF